MNAAERRTKITELLAASDRPMSATALAARCGVSRQIIVGDIAILRAGGAEISATPRGYVLPRATDGITRTIACMMFRWYITPISAEKKMMVGSTWKAKMKP